VERHDYEIEDYIDQQVHLELCFLFSAKTNRAVQENGFLKKVVLEVVK
jgi:hypothetical protein